MSKKNASVLLAAVSMFFLNCAGSWHGEHGKTEWSITPANELGTTPHMSGEAVLVIKNSTADTIRVAPGANRAWYEIAPGKKIRMCGMPKALGEKPQITVDGRGYLSDWRVWELEGVTFWEVRMNDKKLKITK